MEYAATIKEFVLKNHSHTPHTHTYTHIETHSDGVILIAFPRNNDCTNAHHVYVIRTLHKGTDMLNVTADRTEVAAAEMCTCQNLYTYVTTSVQSEVLTALTMKPDR